ncbi:MAG: hypothetical protein OXG83_01750 [Acidobacteria bacterium]|nr:hypothetical protein [Acidobacteriota bacterium]
MQDAHVGDIGDFAKYGLLRHHLGDLAVDARFAAGTDDGSTPRILRYIRPFEVELGA